MPTVPWPSTPPCAQDGWRGNRIKAKMVRNAVRAVLGDEAETESILEIVRAQHDY